MAQCEVGGNEYDKTMEIMKAGETHVFDSFECAIHAIAPTCAHCAERSGVQGARDRVEA
jgi:hypothetical protein